MNRLFDDNQATTGSKMSDIYEMIKADIIKGRWRPGKKLSIANLRDEYDISLSPLREALSRLSALGFIESEKQRGFRVAGVSKHDLFDLNRMRIQIESWAIREAIERGDKVWEGDVIAALHRLNRTAYEKTDNSGNISEEWTKCHKDFHFALVSACQSKWLMRFRDNLFDEMDRYRNLSIEYSQKRRELAVTTGKKDDDPFNDDHKLMVDAILAGDADRACNLIERHFTKTVKIVSHVLEQQQFDS